MDINELLKSKKKVFLDGGTGSEIQRLGGTMGPAFSGLACFLTRNSNQSTRKSYKRRM